MRLHIGYIIDNEKTKNLPIETVACRFNKDYNMIFIIGEPAFGKNESPLHKWSGILFTFS